KALYSTDRRYPRWLPGAGFGAIQNIGGSEVAGLSVTLGDSGTRLDAEWKLEGLDYYNEAGFVFRNDWRTDISFVAYDRGGNESPRMSPIEAWWIMGTAAHITSPRYNGAPTR